MVERLHWWRVSIGGESPLERLPWSVAKKQGLASNLNLLNLFQVRGRGLVVVGFELDLDLDLERLGIRLHIASDSSCMRVESMTRR